MILRNWLVLFFCWAPYTYAALTVIDDTGNQLILPGPATRVISLAPHATELIFTLGKGSTIVGVDSASNYPEAARQITRVADFQSVQLDKILLLKPDLVIFWHNQALEKQQNILKKAGIAVFISRPQSFSDIAASLERLGVLLGVEHKGRQEASALLKEVQQIRQEYKTSRRIKVYMQIANNPLLSVSNRLFIGKMLADCGADNIFADAKALTPLVNIETVLQQNPEVMFYTHKKETFLQRWLMYPQLSAVKNSRMIAVDSDFVSRPGPRLIIAQRLICNAIDDVRKQINASNK